MSAEAQLPNLLPESYKTDFSLFIDAGNVWGVDYSDTIDDTNKYKIICWSKRQCIIQQLAL